MSAVTSLPPSAPGSAGSLRRIWGLIRPRPLAWIAGVVLSCLALGSAIALMATSAWLISEASLQPPILSLTVAVVAVRAFGIGRAAFRYVERLSTHHAALGSLVGLRSTLVGRLARTAPVGPQAFGQSDTVTRLVDDVDNTSELWIRVVVPRVTAVVIGAAVIGLVAWLLPLAAVWLLVCLLIAGVAAPALARLAAARSARLSVVEHGELAQAIGENLRYSMEIISAGRTADYEQRISTLDRSIRQSELGMARTMGASAAASALAQGLALIGVVAIAVPAVSAGALSGVNLAVVVLLPLAAFELTAGLAAATVARLRASASAQRLVAILDTPETNPDPASVAADWTPPVRSDAAIEAELVGVTWPGSSNEAVSGVTATARPGQPVLVVGPSGSGKSTFAAACAGLIPVTSGTMRLAGVDYAHLTGDQVRQAVVYCAQDAHIFDNSVAANLLLARPGASDELLWKALDAVGLREWVQDLPAGLETSVGETGTAMSAGQRQRLSLARVVLADPSIVIIDEPTEHLDDATALRVADTIRHLFADRTLIVISHTRMGFDWIPSVVELSPARDGS